MLKQSKTILAMLYYTDGKVETISISRKAMKLPGIKVQDTFFKLKDFVTCKNKCTAIYKQETK